jgi:hypothetical protein
MRSRKVAREFVEQQKVRWSKPHAADVLHRLEIYIFPHIGGRPIADIATPELLDVIRKPRSSSPAICPIRVPCSANIAEAAADHARTALP